MKATLLVMAAGMGSRYGGLKQVDPIGPSREGIIDYSVFDAVRAGFSKVVFIIREDIEEEFRRVIGAKHEQRVRVEYVFQRLRDIPEGYEVPPDRTKPWGTAQAVLAAAAHIREPFAVINGDDFYGAGAYEVHARYLETLDPTTPTFSMVGYRLKNTLSDHGSVSRGLCQIDEQENLQSVVERLQIEKVPDGVPGGAVAREPDGDLDLCGDEIVSMNMFGFTPVVFPMLERRFADFLAREGRNLKAEYLLPQVVGEMVRTGDARVRVLTSDASWFGITYREDRQEVVNSIRRLVEQGAYPSDLSATGA